MTLIRILKWPMYALTAAATAGFALVLVGPYLFGVQYIIVLSGSMTPVLPVGSVIVVQQMEPSEVQVGDVVTYWHPDDLTVLVTHRVMDHAVTESGAAGFQTKGDANEEQDGYVVPPENVWGEVRAVVPQIGYARDFVKTLPGFLSLFLLPGVVLLANEFVSLRNEYSRRRKVLLRRRRPRRV